MKDIENLLVVVVSPELTDSVQETYEDAVELKVVSLDVLDKVFHSVGQVLHVLGKVLADAEQLLDRGQELGVGQETVVQARVEEVPVLGEDLVHREAVRDGGDQADPGRLNDFDTHVVREVLYQVHHLLPQSKRGMINLELFSW